MKIQPFVEDLNHRFFGGQLSRSFQEQLLKLPIDRPDVFAFVERMFGFVSRAGIPAQDMSVLIGEILGTLLARILPGGWEGRIPPITLVGRHAVLDQYLANNRWTSKGHKTMLDIGCGFPPFTTIDSANAFPSWHITGADPSLPEYLVYDAEGNYATFDENHSVVYFQPSIPTVENWNALLKDRAATKTRFENLLNALLQQPSANGDGLPRLEKHPIKQYETDRVSFLKGGIGQLAIAPQDIIRCFNVLLYFDDPFFAKTLTWLGGKVKEGGLVLLGANWAASTECYYHVYQKTGASLVPREFAFSLDCVCPIGILSWYANHDDDRQTAQLADYVAVIRKDKAFMETFYAFHDAQRSKYGICPRNEEGYYGILDPTIGPHEVWVRVGKMLEEMNAAGLNQKAVDVLKRSGQTAWVNEVGHVAVRPPNP